jgi:uncharacterized protein (DUF1330 family)
VAAYIVVQVNVKDADTYEQYKKLTPLSLSAYGGRFIVRGGPTETLEGTWSPERFVVVEFPDAESARAWWSSDEYAPARKLRQASAHTEMILAEGLSGTP